ncbi:MAG: hypothetical protein ACPG6B_06625 [Oceanihabitans sp.]
MNLLDDKFTENEEKLYSLIDRKATRLLNNSKKQLIKIIKNEYAFNREKPLTAEAFLKIIEKWQKMDY